MDLQRIKLQIQDQFPEFYREEFPQFVSFVTKYYEYLATTDYALADTIKDVDESLDAYVSVIKQQFAINIPEFGKLSDRDFLIFAKDFYASRGSEDSYKFLFRAMYGKEIDIIYPGESLLKSSDGVWNQEVSVRVDFTESTGTFASGNTATATAFDLIGQPFTVESPSGTRAGIDCIRVNKISSTIYDVYIDRAYTGKIAVGDAINYIVRKEEFQTDGVLEVKELPLTGVVLATPSSVVPVLGGTGFVTGTLFSIPGILPLRFRIKKTSSTGAIIAIEIIQPGFVTDILDRRYCILDPADKTSLQFNADYYSSQTYCGADYFDETGLDQYLRGDIADGFVPTANQAIVRIDEGSTLLYPGLYTSAKGFLSDAMKLQDNDYHQSFSYVIRLDEQLSAYKSIVKRLLHPAGMQLWAEFNVSNQFDVRAAIARIDLILRQFVEDDVLTSDAQAFDFTLQRYDTALNKIYALDYFGDSGVNAYTEEEDYPTFDIITPKVDAVSEQPDSGLLVVIPLQDYCEPTYFAEVGPDQYTLASQQMYQDYTRDNFDYFADIDANAYCTGEVSEYRILHPGITRPENDASTTVESGYLRIEFEDIYAYDYFAEEGMFAYSVGIQEQYRYLHDGILRPTNDETGVSDSSTIEVGLSFESDSITVTEQLGFLSEAFLFDQYQAVESGEISVTGSQNLSVPILNGIVAIPKDSINTLSESGKIVIQSYRSEDIYAIDYVDLDNNETYAYGNETNNILLWDGIVAIPKDSINTLSESGKIVIQSYASEDIYSVDYAEFDNDQTYAYGNEYNNVLLWDGIVAIPKDSINTLSESGKIVIQSYRSEDIYAIDYVDLDNNETYAYSNETDIRIIYSGILRPENDTVVTIEEITVDSAANKDDTVVATETVTIDSAINKDDAISTLSESGKIVIQSYVSEDIYAVDYVDLDNSDTYAYSNETDNVPIWDGIVAIPKDEVFAVDSGDIVVQSYVLEDIYANDGGYFFEEYSDTSYSSDTGFVDRENDQTYAYGGNTNNQHFSNDFNPVDNQAKAEDVATFSAIFNLSSELISLVDSGTIALQLKQSYAEDGFFSEEGASAYATDGVTEFSY